MFLYLDAVSYHMLNKVIALFRNKSFILNAPNCLLTFLSIYSLIIDLGWRQRDVHDICCYDVRAMESAAKFY